jgi:hypothetical protein
LVFARTTLLLFSSGESFRAKERVSLARPLKTEVRDSFQQLISIESNKTFIFPLSHSMQCALLLVVAAPLFFSLPLSRQCVNSRPGYAEECIVCVCFANSLAAAAGDWLTHT